MSSWEDIGISTVILCPACRHGNSREFPRALAAGYWGTLVCERCKHTYVIAHAIHEMFVQGFPSGYVLFLRRTLVTRDVVCQAGETVLVDVRGIFDQVYRIIPAYSGSLLGGGLSVHYVPQGYIQVGLAPGPGFSSSLSIFLMIVGKGIKDPPLPLWMELLLEARLAAFHAPRIVPILAVSAMDLFVEEITGKVVSTHRPGAWNLDVENVTGKRLSDMLRSGFKDLERLVQIRNKLAHSGDYIDKLPITLQSEERDWRENGHYHSGEDAVAPSALFALRTVLNAIRACQAKLNGGAFVSLV